MLRECAHRAGRLASLLALLSGLALWSSAALSSVADPGAGGVASELASELPAALATASFPSQDARIARAPFQLAAGIQAAVRRPNSEIIQIESPALAGAAAARNVMTDVAAIHYDGGRWPTSKLPSAQARSAGGVTDAPVRALL